MDDDCPFTYREGEEPPIPEHEQIGECWHCSEPAYTLDANGEKACWACAYNSAN